MIGKVDIDFDMRGIMDKIDLWKWPKKVRQEFCRAVWNFSEWSGIGLGCLAPAVFFHMIGAREKRRL